MTKSTLLIGIVLLSMVAMFGRACAQQPEPAVEYSVPELEYRLISHFENVFWCDPDFYPIEREGQEQENALEQFAAISANTVEFSALWRIWGCRKDPNTLTKRSYRFIARTKK